MISAELSHNPYLLETTARFNGHSPKINSAIEKYDKRPLVEWVKEVPCIFHDEMNGFDFDFSFTGTDADYAKVIKAFRSQGADPEDVRITRMGELEDVLHKRKEIASLLEWLDSHRNRRFDFDKFMSENSETLDASVPYIIVQEEPSRLELPLVSIEVVESVLELGGTVLFNVPILITISRQNRARVRDELRSLLARTDIEQRQLFFLIHPAMNSERVIRIISDLGVRHPQIVDGPDDQRIIEYLEDYPATEYVRKAIRVLRTEVDGIKDMLTRMSRFSEATNAGVREKVRTLDAKTEALKTSRACLEYYGEYVPQQQFSNACNELMAAIVTWRNKKVSVSEQEQIDRAALEYAQILQGAFRSFESRITTMTMAEQTRIDKSLKDIYQEAGEVPFFSPGVPPLSAPPSCPVPNMRNTFASMTEITYVSTRNELLNLLGAFAEQSDEKKPVPMANYETWRSAARETLMPLAQVYIDAHTSALSDYQASVTNAYKQQLEALIQKCGEDKEQAASKLSNVERQTQEDWDWLAEFEDMLVEIERS